MHPKDLRLTRRFLDPGFFLGLEALLASVQPKRLDREHQVSLVPQQQGFTLGYATGRQKPRPLDT